MKSFNVDALLTDRDTIQRAVIKSCKSKKKKPGRTNRKYLLAQKILANPDPYVDRILEMMVATKEAYTCMHKGRPVPQDISDKMYKTAKCMTFRVVDGPTRKERDIASVPLFPDQFVHQLLIEAGCEPMMNGFYHHSYGSVPGKGEHAGQRAVRRVIERSVLTDKSAIKYVAKLDIKKCYPSIAHRDVERLLKRRFRGWFYTSLFLTVIDSYHDKLVDGEKVGLPIGYSTSQWLCNFVLTPIDYFIKHDLQVEHYFRYVDDMVLFGRNKKVLHDQVRRIDAKLAQQGMTIKSNWQVYRFDYIDRYQVRRGRDIDYLGLRFFRNKTILRKRLALTIARQARKLRRKRVSARQARSFMARVGWLRHCDSKRFYAKNVKPNINIRKLKGVIKNEDRKHGHAAKPL